MQRNVTIVGEDESLALAEQLMLWNTVRHLPVLRPADGQLTGMLSSRDILRAYQESPDDPRVLTHAVRQHMTSPVVHVRPDALLTEAAAELVAHKLGCLPVVDAAELVGIVTVGDVLSAAPRSFGPAREAAAEVEEPVVASIMFPEPIAVHEDDSLVDTARRMVQTRVRHACVVDGEGRVTGIVSDRDLRRVFGDPRRAQLLERLRPRVRAPRVRDAMTRRPRTVGQDEPVSAALQVFTSNRIGALPVVDARDRLRGIVSYVDVLAFMAERDKQRAGSAT